MMMIIIMIMMMMKTTTNKLHSVYLVALCLSLATAFVAPADTTTASAVVVASVPGASLVANWTSIPAEDVATASFANGRLPAGVPLTVRLSAACSKR